MNRASLIFLILPFLNACIGTDLVDDPVVGESIRISPSQIPLLIDGTAQANATFFNQIGLAESAAFEWTSSNESIATVDPTGLITALASGQASITAAFRSATSSGILVTVVADANDVAQIAITVPQTTLGLGQTAQLEVQASNIAGVPIEGLAFDFASSTPSVLSVNTSGVITGVSTGMATVHASAEGIESNPVSIIVGVTSRMGNFQNANGYNASGNARLFFADNGNLMLELSSNFSTSFALGTFIYLSNTSSGTGTFNTGLEVQQITTGGYHLFNISNISPSTGITDFNNVIILCKPARITFGFATLN